MPEADRHRRPTTQVWDLIQPRTFEPQEDVTALGLHQREIDRDHGGAPA
jgi:hypothetical protein